jgi:hypothetical protein
VKTIYNPDRSTFEVAHAGYRERTERRAKQNREAGKVQDPPRRTKILVPPGKTQFPDDVADHIAAKLAVWGVRIVNDAKDEIEAAIAHTEAVKKWARAVLAKQQRDHSAEIAAGLPVADTEDVTEAKRILTVEAPRGR